MFCFFNIVKTTDMTPTKRQNFSVRSQDSVLFSSSLPARQQGCVCKHAVYIYFSFEFNQNLFS